MGTFVETSGVDPKLVFAHPILLPGTSTDVTILPWDSIVCRRSAWQTSLCPLPSWEDGSRKSPVTQSQSTAVARLYNAVISSIIEGATNWTLENGYRNIIANMGIGLDGTFRNIIGRDAESLVKNAYKELAGTVRSLILEQSVEATEFRLPNGYSMKFGSEPDVLFRQVVGGNERMAATIEIKGGKDPAGALERLGAMQKSFEATPPGCVNFLVAGVVTPEMRARLDQMGVVKVYVLDDLAHDGEKWTEFVNELFPLHRADCLGLPQPITLPTVVGCSCNLSKSGRLVHRVTLLPAIPRFPIPSSVPYPIHMTPTWRQTHNSLR